VVLRLGCKCTYPLCMAFQDTFGSRKFRKRLRKGRMTRTRGSHGLANMIHAMKEGSDSMRLSTPWLVAVPISLLFPVTFQADGPDRPRPQGCYGRLLQGCALLMRPSLHAGSPPLVLHLRPGPSWSATACNMPPALATACLVMTSLFEFEGCAWACALYAYDRLACCKYV